MTNRIYEIDGGAGGISETSDKEYFDFKQYIIVNFLNPIMKRNYDSIKKNYYNFDYITQRLIMFKNNRNKHDVEFIIKVIDILRYSTNTQQSLNLAKEKLYGQDNKNMLLVETTRIVLKSHYEIYNILFGQPHKTKPNHLKYEIHLLNEIKNIVDDNPGILFDDVKSRLEPKYGHRFIE